MLTTVILSFVVLLFFTVVPVNYRGQTRYKNGMLFAVTLPPHAMEDEQLKDVQAEFGKRFKRMLWWMAAALVPVLLLYNWIGYQVIYLILWALGFNAAANIWFRQGFRATLALKRENEWFVGEKRVIQSDLRAAYLKNQRSAPLGLFAIPLAMAAGWYGGDARAGAAGDRDRKFDRYAADLAPDDWNAQDEGQSVQLKQRGERWLESGPAQVSLVLMASFGDFGEHSFPAYQFILSERQRVRLQYLAGDYFRVRPGSGNSGTVRIL